MIFENGKIGVLRSDPHLLLFPVGAVTILIFAFNLLGDALNDAFNPAPARNSGSSLSLSASTRHRSLSSSQAIDRNAYGAYN